METHSAMFYRKNHLGETVNWTAQAIIDEHNMYYTHDHNDSLFVKKLREHGLDDDQIAGVLETISEVCEHCYNNHNKCQCWNDD